MPYDLIIVGGGAAGLTAALFASRRAVRTLLISQDIGGQAATTEEIENYPGVDFTGGPALMKKFQHQAARFGTVFAFARVEKLEAAQLASGDEGFRVTTDQQSYEAPALILCHGLSRKKLDVPGERELTGHGISTNVWVDAERFHDQTVAVIGGGNSALDAALRLSGPCRHVYLIHRRDQFSGEAPVRQKIEKTKNVERIVNALVTRIDGKTSVASVTIAAVADPARTRALAVTGVFVEIGFEVNRQLIEGFVDLIDSNHIRVNDRCETSRPGVFAAGDITSGEYKQIIISAGEGAKAGLQAYKYLLERGIISGAYTRDWGIRKLK